jgi:ketosteroid isomerase-like protein
MSTADDQIRALVRRWVDAEIAGDAETLDRLAVDDFHFVGPAGFVLDKRQWLHRYPSGDLVTTALQIGELAVRDHGPAAVTIGVYVQQASYRGNPMDGTFRLTFVTLRDGAEWRLAGAQLSPMLGAPPATPGT